MTPTAKPAEATATPSPSPAATWTPRPEPTATATPVPAADLAVLFLNNFCRAGEPLLVSIYNLTAAPVMGRLLRLRLSSADGLLEETDRRLSIPPLGSVNLPLAAPAQSPWVAVQTWLIDDGPVDPEPANNAAVCQVSGGDAPPASTAASQPAGALGGGAEPRQASSNPRRASVPQSSGPPAPASPTPEPAPSTVAAPPLRAAANRA
ncbi:MAG TPA: hypothetical protein VNN21_07830, partial [Dehalococcoidia bacterium]|nr:hypothetical protein [Dehalococcoidia bacterium]